MAKSQVTANNNALAPFSMQLRSRKKEKVDLIDEITSRHRTTLRTLITEAGTSLPPLPTESVAKIEATSELAKTSATAPNKSKAKKVKEPVEQSESSASVSEIKSKPDNKRKQQTGAKAPVQSPNAPANKRTRGGKPSVPPMVITEVVSSLPISYAEPEDTIKALSPAPKPSPGPALKRGKKADLQKMPEDVSVSNPPPKSMLQKQQGGKKVVEALVEKGKGGSRKRLAVASPEKVETVQEAQNKEAFTGFVASPAFIAPAPEPISAVIDSGVARALAETQSLPKAATAEPSKAKSITPAKPSRKQAKIQKRDQESGSRASTHHPAAKVSSGRNPFASPLAASVKLQPPPPSPHPLLQESTGVAQVPPVSSQVTPKKAASPGPLRLPPPPSPQLLFLPDTTLGAQGIEAIIAFSFDPVLPASSPAQMMATEARAEIAPVQQSSPERKTSGLEQLSGKQRPKALRVPVVSAPAAEVDAAGFDAPNGVLSLKADLLSPPLPVAALPLLVASPALEATALQLLAAREDKKLDPAPPSLKGEVGKVDEARKDPVTTQAAPLAAQKSSYAPLVSGGNLVGAIRSFLPQKKVSSPQIAAGKKPVKVKALEIAQAAKKAEEARLVLHSAATSSSVPPPPAIVGGGQVKAKAAAFQQRIEASQKSSALTSNLPQPLSKQVPQGSNVRAQPFGSFAAASAPRLAMGSGPSATSSGPGPAPPLSSATAPAAAEDKHKRAEMRRKEEEDRKRAEMEARQKLKEDRMKAPVAKPAAPVPLKQLPSSSSQAPLQPSKSINQPSVIAAPPSAKKSVRASEAATALPAAAEDTFSLKPLPTVKGTPNSTKAHAMDSAQHPPLTPADLRNIQNLVASPYVSLAPASIKKPTIINYEISPYRPNADEEDEEEWAEQSRKKAVPEWTLPLNLAPALVLQGKMDPDRIFNWRQKTCPLEEIFEGMSPLPAPTDPAKAKKPKRDWRKRGSSGDWIIDRLTWQEDLEYRRVMNYV